MTPDAESAEVPFVQAILHPTDFSEASRAAFAHALAIALLRQASFALLHASRQHIGEDEWSKFPSVRRTLEDWGLLEPGSPRSAVYEKLRVRIDKISYRGDPLSAVVGYLNQKSADLLVVGTEQRHGLPGWFKQSTAAKIARHVTTNTLFVPEGARGIVSAKDGEVQLRRILVPVDHVPDPARALVYASRACQLAPDEEVTTTVLHVGDVMPQLEIPDGARCRYEESLRQGDVVDTIVGAAVEMGTDLIVMASDGRDGPLDVLRGSFSERVVRHSPCPVLVVPQS